VNGNSELKLRKIKVNNLVPKLKFLLILFSNLFKTSPLSHLRWVVNMVCGMLCTDYTVQCKYSSSTSLTQLTSDLSCTLVDSTNTQTFQRQIYICTIKLAQFSSNQKHCHH